MGITKPAIIILVVCILVAALGVLIELFLDSSIMGRTKCGIIIIAVVCILVAALAVLLGMSMRTVETYEVAVGYDTVSKKLSDDVKSGGLYAFAPASDLLIFPNVFKAMSFTGDNKISCLNHDGVIIDLDITYQFRARTDLVVDFIRKYRDYDNYKEMLKILGTSAIQKVCSQFDTYSVIGNRTGFANAVKHKVQEEYKNHGSDLSGLQVDNIARPPQYKEALLKREASRENSVVKLNERRKLLIEASTKLSKAESDAQIRIANAEQQAKTTLLKARAEAEVIVKQFEVEADIYRQLKDAGFSGKSLLTYLEVDMLSASQHAVFVGLEAPVNTSSIED